MDLTATARALVAGWACPVKDAYPCTAKSICSRCQALAREVESALRAAQAAALREAYTDVAAEHLEDPQPGTSDVAYENGIADALSAIDKLLRDRASRLAQGKT